MHHQEIMIISDTSLSQPFEIAWSHYMMHTYANFYEYNIKTEKTSVSLEKEKEIRTH